MASREITVSGAVQGVGFRDFVQRLARSSGVAGEVWNGEDGTVHIHAEHKDEEMLQMFEKQVWSGPGRIMDVRSSEAATVGYSEFRVGISR